MSKKARVFSRDFKVRVVRRMLAGENVTALARDVRFSARICTFGAIATQSGGAEALRGCGRPRKAEVTAKGARDKAAETRSELLSAAEQKI